MARVAVNGVALAPGGGLTYLLSQAKEFELLDPEWEFTYFVPPRCAEPLRSAVCRGAVRVPFRDQPGYVQRLIWEQVTFPRILRDEGFDLVSALGGFAVFRAPIPQVVTDHNSIHHASSRHLGMGMLMARARIERVVARRSARRAEAVIYLTNAFTESMMRVGFPAPTAIIPSGVSVHHRPGKPTTAREDSHGPDGEAVFPLACSTCQHGGFALAVHNWYPHKRLKWLIRAWPPVTAATGLHLVVLGGAVGRRQLRDRTRARADSRAQADPVIHVVDGLPHAQLVPLYQSASLYVSASVLEAFPLTPLEAMAAGVPCVLSDIAAHREVAGSAAEYFVSGRSDSLLDAVIRALDARPDFVEQGLRKVESYQWSTNAREFINVFTELLGCCASIQTKAADSRRSSSL